MTEFKKGMIAGLEEVLILQKQREIWDMNLLIETINYAIAFLEKNKEEIE